MHRTIRSLSIAADDAATGACGCGAGQQHARWQATALGESNTGVRRCRRRARQAPCAKPRLARRMTAAVDRGPAARGIRPAVAPARSAAASVDDARPSCR